MRALAFGALLIAAPLVGCNQDSASSNSERETHMGDIRGVGPGPGDSMVESKPSPAQNAASAPVPEQPAAAQTPPPGAAEAPKKERP